MPTYEFHHIIHLTAAQKGTLARLVTNWHASTFRAPRFIVNCRFVDIQSAPLEDNYIGGKPFKSNKLFVSLRSGTGRTEEQYAAMTKTLVDMWHEAVKGTPSPEHELKDVLVMGTLDSAFERGWFLPMVCPGPDRRRNSS
jgi:phenylpyruvate tautomerase PptA (4-oxalocrotonate tautomerase family)